MMDTVRRLVDAIQALCNPCGIVLYGAKQDLLEEGPREVNLCVIVKAEPKETERMLYRMLDADLVFNLLLYQEEDWNRLIADPTSYAAGIRQKGVLLHGKA